MLSRGPTLKTTMIFSSFDRTSKPVEDLQFGSNFLSSKDLHNTEGANLHMSGTERERDRDRQTETERDRHRQRQTETDRDRQRETETETDR